MRNVQRILFLDRDGTIIKEPPDQQVDSLEKLEFVPGAIGALSRLSQSGLFTLVLVTNQDGLGTHSFPENQFWPAQNLMIRTLAGEGVKFSDICIDRSLPADGAPTRKPGTAMLTRYLQGTYDLPNSWVIGDRTTDVELAHNLGCRAIQFGHAPFEAWSSAAHHILSSARTSQFSRKTNETSISGYLALGETGHIRVDTGLGFFNHMLEQLAKHGGFELDLTVTGDLAVDEHHTVEDTAIALGQAIRQALGDKRGIGRYGFVLPMDESMAQVALDLSGRSHLTWDAHFVREKVGDVPTELFSHFFKSLCDGAQCTLHVLARGENEHHKIEGIFKAVARAFRQAIRLDDGNGDIPTTKGIL